MLCAVEEVFATACLEGSEIDMEVFQEVFMAADAFVFSQVSRPSPPPADSMLVLP